jgi:hypothetical protein
MKPLPMKNSTTGLLLWALCALLAVLPARAPAEDIDIFVTNSTASSTFDNPNVLIILDNTSNWSRASQKWPADPDTGEAQKQGEAELRAIKTVIGTLNESINVGLMLFTDTGAGREGGYIRFPVMQMTLDNKTAFATLVQYIYDQFSSPSEKTSSSANYSSVMFDAFKYFGGYTSPSNVASGTAGTPADATHFGPMVYNQRTDATLSDVGGYTSAARTTYSGPISTANACAKNFLIFIGNGFPNADIGSPSPMNTYLAGIGGNTTQLAVPGFTTVNDNTTADIDYTSACYANQGACVTTDFASQCGTGVTCSCTGTSTTTLGACPAGQSRYSILGTNTSIVGPVNSVFQTNAGTTSACYATAPSGTGLSGDQFGMTCPASPADVTSGGVTTHKVYSCAYTVGSTSGASCTAPITATSPSNACYAQSAAGVAAAQAAIAPTPTSGTDHGTLTTCPAGYSCTWADSAMTITGAACVDPAATGPAAPGDATATSLTTSCHQNTNAARDAADRGSLACPTTNPGDGVQDANGVYRTTTFTCTYAYGNPSPSCGAGAGSQFTVTRTLHTAYAYNQVYVRHLVTQTQTPTGSSYKYNVTQTVNQAVTTTTSGTTNLGNTQACYSSPPTGTPSDSRCSGYTSCAFGAATTANACPAGTARFLVQRTSTTGTTVVSNNTFAVPASNKQRMTDEWARYMYQTDVNSAAGQQNISTYTIDVFNAQQDADQTALLMSMARVGGGKYFAAKSKNAIIAALKNIMSEIQAVNTAFASASLPVNATNRAQNENQVFIGMFRPDPEKKPLWFGNVKRFQLANFSGVIDLADFNGDQAVNLQTGFVTDCATSWWTSDSGTYWSTVITNPPAMGKCTTTGFDKYSDSPDGPLVEKGAAAEVIRKGNNPPTTDSSPTYAFNRTVKTLPLATLTSSSLVDFTTSSSGLSADLVNFILGKDVKNELVSIKPVSSLPDWSLATPATRPSLHGDVIHSRPLPVNFSTATDTTAGVTVFYGANDGTLRALNATNGQERWAFIAPEFFPRLSRLMDNSPIVQFPPLPSAGTRKDYFWDGSAGIYQNLDNTKVWIFPTMRRGGRMLYAFNVTTVDSPTLMWKLGCPNLTDDTDCTAAPPETSDPGRTDMRGIGQTWSLPSVAFIKGYSLTEPVLVVGGGFDGCEDEDSSAPSCSSPKGAKIYVIKARDGTILKTFDTLRSVASDVAMVDVDNDGYVDYAYVADTGGNFYRVDFVDGAASYATLTAADWAIYRVAYTTGTGSPVSTAPRKFFFPPALLYTSGRVYVAVGSGDREHPLHGNYPFNDVLNRFYVYLDTLSVKPTTPTDADPAMRPVDLDDVTLLNNNTSATSCESDQILASSTKKGWFMDLNQYGQGEQTVTSALILGGLVTFSTNRPIDPERGSCSTTLGEARGYWVNLLNGSGGIGIGTSGTCGGDRSATFVGGGLPPSPVTGVVPVGGVSRTVVIGAVQRDGTASAPIGGQKVVPSIKAIRKRVYWFKNIDN